MKKTVGLCSGFLLILCVSAFAQIDTTYIYNPSMPYGTLDIRIAKSPTRYYYLQEDITFSYRESSPGVKSNTYRDLTSWNSSPYRQGNLREKNGTNDYFIMNYRFLLPNNYNADYDPGYPIIIMFHGLGERGNCWDDNCYWNTTAWNPNTNSPPAPTTSTHSLLNNDHNLLHGGLKHLNAVNLAGSKLPDDPTLSPNAFPGIVVFPQNLNGWHASTVQDAIRLLRLIIKKYNVDENRVYIHGLSNGGGAVFQAIKRAPWLFAAALGMSAINDGGIINDGLARETGKIPLWVFQGGLDANPTPSKTYNMVKKLREAGAVVRYYLYPHLGHGTWNTAYNEPDFFRWILSHRKNNPHIYYGNPVICNTTGAGVPLSFSGGFPAYQWERDGVIISDANQSQYVANTPGSYRGRFSRVVNPGPNDWEPWSKPIVVTEINPPKPSVNAIGTTHLRGPGLLSTSENNTVILRADSTAELYTWYKNGAVLNFTSTDVNDTLRTVSFTSTNTAANGAYTLVASYSYCPSPPSDPVYLFFNNSAPQNMAFDPANADFKGKVMSSGIFLTWNDLVSNEIGYEIWRKKSGTTDFKFAGRTAKDAISFYDSPLEPSTTYLYKIRAIGKTGASNYVPSNSLDVNYEITTGGDNTPPLPPQQLTRTGNTLESISLSWKPSADNTGIKEYIISYGSNSVSTQTSVTSFTIQNLQPNEVYPITVRAVDFAGHVSAPSNQILATTYVLGLFYKHSTGAWSDLDDSTLAATWVNPEFTGTLNNFSLAPRTQEDFFNFQFTGYLDILTEGDYIFRVTSNDGSRLLLDDSIVVDNDGQHGNIAVIGDTIHLTAGPHPLEVQYFDYVGSQSLTVHFKGPDLSAGFAAIPDSLLRSGKYVPAPLPLAPFDLQAQASGMQRIDLAWQYSTAGEVEVYRALNENETFSLIGRSSSNSYTDTVGLKPGTIYYYKIRTINNSGSSDFTPVVSATTTSDTIVPSIPGSLALSNKTHTHAAFTWTASTDNVGVTGYEVFVNGQRAGTTQIPAFTVTSLAPNTAYDLSVKAFDASGNTSASSATLAIVTNPSAVYYSMATGNLNALTTWKQNANGTGNSPESFAENGQYFIISNRSATGMGGAWDVSGDASKIIVPTGTTFTVDNALTGKIEIEGTATLVLNHAAIPELVKISPASTVNFNLASTIPVNTYGNILLAGTGVKTFEPGTTTIAGNLTVNSGLTMKGASANATRLIVGGNILFNGTGVVPGADNRIHVHFTQGIHSISTAYDVALFKISADDNAVVNLIQSAAPVNLTVGSLNGGGLTLPSGSMLNINSNTLALVNAGTINAQNETGRVSVNGGDLKLSSTASASSNLYFDTNSHSVDTLQLDFSGTGALSVRQPLDVSGAVKVKNGQLNADGQITLLSTALKTASVSTIENGLISGDINFQTYIQPLGDSWRDLSTGVRDITVADWQAYFPITGAFSGASTGPGLTADPSMFISTGSGLAAYPAVGSSNQAPIQQGRGYTARLNNSSPITINVSGNPFQGNISFNLNTGSGGGANNGWNLVGNPYASPIIWSNNPEAWIKSSINNTAAVRENKLVNGQSVSQYKYYNPLLGDGVIQSGQAFWVQAISQSPSLVITEQAKGVALNTYPHPDASLMHFSVSLQQGSLIDPAYILFTSQGTDAFDSQLDALKKQNEGMFSLSTIIGSNINAAINNLPDSFCSKEVKLNIQQAQPGNYTLVFGSLSSLSSIGSVRLTDAFTGTNTAITGVPYSFTVTGDPNSHGANRFKITFTRTALDITTPQVQADHVCDQDSALVTILHSQPGVEYAVLNAGDQVISTAAEGNGASIVLEVDKTKLSAGANHIRVRAGFKGCETQMLTSEADVNYLPAFSIEGPNDISVCVGEQAMLQVSGTPSGGYYRWFDENNQVIDSVNDATLITGSVWSETVFHVAGVSANGCESERKSIHVYADSLEVPVVTMFNDTLFVQVDAIYQWKKDGQIIAGAGAPFYKPDVSGQYSVIAFRNGCSKESEPFNYVIDPGCTVDTTTPRVVAEEACGAETVMLSILNSQSGVTYTAIDGNNEVVSSPESGSGGTIELELAGALLDSGANHIRIRADQEGCVDRMLLSEVTFNHVHPFNVIAEDTVHVCEGNVATISVAGVPAGGHYAWYDASEKRIEGVTQNTFTTQPVFAENVMFVSAIHSSGCESEKKKITISPLIISVPVITIQNNSLTTNATGSYQWKINGQILHDATSAVYTPLTSGSYTVVVSQDNCTKESAPFAFFITAVNAGYTGEFVLNTFPVPSTASDFRVSVQSPGNEPIVIQVIDISGRPVFSKSFGADELGHGVPINPSAGTLSDGIYCVIATQGKVEVRKRIVIAN